MNQSFDVVVVGGGPAGIAAAVAASSSGHSVAVIDDNPTIGGQIWRASADEAIVPSNRRKARLLRAFEVSGTAVFAGCRVIDVSRPKVLRLAWEHRAQSEPTDVAWKKLILATGARERLLPFPGWTLPGVFAAGGLQALVKAGFSVRGKRVAIAGTGPLLLAVAAHLHSDGADISTIAEQASLSSLVHFGFALRKSPAKAIQGFKYRVSLAASRYRSGCWPVAALGEEKVEKVRWTNGRRVWEETVDLLACGFHLFPNTELAQLLGCELRNDAVVVDAHQETTVSDVFACGETGGIAGVDAAMIQGTIAGLSAAERSKDANALLEQSDAERAFAKRLSETFALRSELASLCDDSTIVCRCEDVTYGQLRQRSSWTDAKLHTRCGMGACQGRTCGSATATLFGWHNTATRPPVYPALVSALCSSEITENQTLYQKETV